MRRKTLVVFFFPLKTKNPKTISPAKDYPCTKFSYLTTKQFMGNMRVMSFLWMTFFLLTVNTRSQLFIWNQTKHPPAPNTHHGTCSGWPLTTRPSRVTTSDSTLCQKQAAAAEKKIKSRTKCYILRKRFYIFLCNFAQSTSQTEIIHKLLYQSSWIKLTKNVVQDIYLWNRTTLHRCL